ncbi:MAG: hypothetical protein Satyrvirus6_26 [Satyrvirus sp.]|uniref:Uncharacterized protein n=1 Tax=Satyrvirus sp. TaxID=2487771 RepID=A0A3G5AF30_9VIRU|nr:MAG: hypothetical protein Satyrvirus6_26 [Satyrvirus sp.]
MSNSPYGYGSLDSVGSSDDDENYDGGSIFNNFEFKLLGEVLPTLICIPLECLCECLCTCFCPCLVGDSGKL